MEETLAEWILANQERIPISGDFIKDNAAKILDRLHLGHELFKFSNGWLEAFKLCHGIKSFCRFGESGFVDMNAVNLPPMNPPATGPVCVEGHLQYG